MEVKSPWNSRVNLIGASILLAAAPIWVLVVLEFSLRQPDHSVYGPIALSGMTPAIHRLIRSFGNAWPLSGLIAGIISLGVLLLSAV
ncbi:MAG: hypothetical protein WCJ09_06650 [Planctomycetota bacterium]